MAVCFSLLPFAEAFAQAPPAESVIDRNNREGILALVEAGEWSAAAKLGAESVDDAPDAAGVRSAYAWALLHVGKVLAAEREVGHALALDDELALAHGVRAALYLRRGDEEQAGRAAKAALSHRPEQTQALDVQDRLSVLDRIRSGPSPVSGDGPGGTVQAVLDDARDGKLERAVTQHVDPEVTAAVLGSFEGAEAFLARETLGRVRAAALEIAAPGQATWVGHEVLVPSPSVTPEDGEARVRAHILVRQRLSLPLSTALADAVDEGTHRPFDRFASAPTLTRAHLKSWLNGQIGERERLLTANFTLRRAEGGGFVIREVELREVRLRLSTYRPPKAEPTGLEREVPNPLGVDAPATPPGRPEPQAADAAPPWVALGGSVGFLVFLVTAGRISIRRGWV